MTCASWLNQVEIWFGIITKQPIRWGTFTSVQRLIDTINDYITHWNQNAKPFTWTTTSDEITTQVRLTHQQFKKLLDSNDDR